MIKTFFTQYKLYVYAIVFVIYSALLWNTAQKSIENKYLKEAQKSMQVAVDEKQRIQDIADGVGASIESALKVYQQKQTEHLRKLLDEMAKDSVYRECRNTPAVVQHFNDKIRRANEAIGK